jgi:ParB-like chromosome segregation protein Spo0J
MTWRDQYAVHPAADVFPMMSDEELAALGADIKQNRVRVPIGFWGKYDKNGRFHGELIDGRNRLEAAERVGFDLDDIPTAVVHCSDPVSWVIALNIHRRHLTKAQQADLIVAAVKAGEKPHQLDEVSRGGRGKVNPVKAKAVEIAEKAGISKPTVERAFAKDRAKDEARATAPDATLKTNDNLEDDTFEPSEGGRPGAGSHECLGLN